MNLRKLLMLCLAAVPFAAGAQDATIRFDIERPVGEVDHNLFGGFQEQPLSHEKTAQLHSLLYNRSGTGYTVSGWNKAYIEGMKELKLANIRCPGGNYIADYDWKDGIGPYDQRPVRYDLAWLTYDTNEAGTDEWVDLNKQIGCETAFCFNLAFGDPNNARFWVEYCNFDSGTYYSDLRAKYGHREPFKVKYWCLGNEVDGAPWIMGYKNSEDYCKIAKETAKAVRIVDPEIKLVACGSSYYENHAGGPNYPGGWIDWNRKVITELTGYADYLSIHRYWEYPADDYYKWIADNALDVEEKIVTTKYLLDMQQTIHPEKNGMKISFDEWAAFGQSMRQILADALYINSFLRHADVVKMANYTTMTSLMSVDRQSRKIYRGPLFQMFKLYSTNMAGNSVDTYVKCDTFDGNLYKGMPYLDVSTVYDDEKGLVYLNVVNVDKDKAIKAEIEAVSGSFSGKAETRTVCHGLDDQFSAASEKNYLPEIDKVNVKDGKVSYTFPAHSFTQIVFEVKR